MARSVLYWSACPIPPADSPNPAEDIDARREALGRVFPGEDNSAYLDALICNAKRRVHPRVAIARLCALSLLPPLLERAGISPAEVLLRRDENGRPYGERRDGSGRIPDFNLSHADGHAICVLLDGEGHAGVDIEELLTPARALPLMNHFCTPGEREILRLAGGNATREAEIFTRIWTMREAICKQDGRGMPLKFDASKIPAGVRLLCGVLPLSGARVSVCLPLGVGEVLAVSPVVEVEWE